MDTELEKLKKLCGFSQGAGFVETPLKGVHFFWSTIPVGRAPLIYPSGVVIVLQGQKIGYLADRSFYYDPDQYLILSVPIPFECETYATEAEPLLGLYLEFDRQELMDLSSIIHSKSFSNQYSELATGLIPIQMDGNLRQAIERLIAALVSRETRLALGQSIVREVFFRMLTGPRGHLINQLIYQDANLEKVQKAITKIRTNYQDRLSVRDLALEAGMSEPSFFRAFHDITGCPPHQYLREMRLHIAKRLIVLNNESVAYAASQVGFTDPAHFSKEFKKLFKVSPSKAKHSGHKPLKF